MIVVALVASLTSGDLSIGDDAATGIGNLATYAGIIQGFLRVQTRTADMKVTRNGNTLILLDLKTPKPESLGLARSWQ